jgi:hypothetical protein
MVSECAIEPTGTAGALAQCLLVTLVRQQGREALAEVTIRISASRFLAPDLIVDDQTEDSYPTHPVTLCVASFRLKTGSTRRSQTAKIPGVRCALSLKHWSVKKRLLGDHDAPLDPIRIDREGTLHARKLKLPLEELASDQPKSGRLLCERVALCCSAAMTRHVSIHPSLACC